MFVVGKLVGRGLRRRVTVLGKFDKVLIAVWLCSHDEPPGQASAMLRKIPFLATIRHRPC
jgi:hypothetical protein